MTDAQRTSLFATVASRDYLQFWQSGLFQPQRVARFLGLSKTDLAHLTGIAPASVRFDAKIPRTLQVKLMDIAMTCELVAQAFDGNAIKTTLWFKLPNPQLNNSSPCELLRRGAGDTLQRLVVAAVAEERP